MEKMLDYFFYYMDSQPIYSVFLSKGWSNWLFNDFYQYSCCNSSSYINCYIYSCSQVSQSSTKKKKRNDKNDNNCKHDGESQKKISTSKIYQNLSMGFSCISDLLFSSSNCCLHPSGSTRNAIVTLFILCEILLSI